MKKWLAGGLMGVIILGLMGAYLVKEEEPLFPKRVKALTAFLDENLLDNPEEPLQEKISRQDAGEQYVLAESYQEVYEVLSSYWEQDWWWGCGVYEEATPALGADGGSNRTAVNEDMAGNAGQTQEKTSYSKTNLQTEGVDESDIVKTDGQYIYTSDSSRVVITDIRGGKLEVAGTISPVRTSAYTIEELYVDGDYLLLVLTGRDISMETSEMAQDSYYYVDSSTVTSLCTYDISDRKKPILLEEVVQEGSYYTSRKIESMVYLFTYTDFQQTDKWEEQIPLVNGNRISADCIYLPERGSRGLVVSSVDIGEPGEVVDNIMILNNYVEIYVSNQAFYLYHNDGGDTVIAKFGMEKGRMDAVGAAFAPGYVGDSFAVNEYQGKLRILTTEYAGNTESNGIYLFDKNLKMTGKLTGLAKGEYIYAARYMGDMAYFITYRNVDPLFAVDLSDDKNPQLLGELKITGYSEYLHFWGENKLLGIGLETDPDTGMNQGVKLAMFDISDPTQLNTIGTYVIRNVSSSPAFYDYKSVLADPGENLFGFSALNYNSEKEQYYFTFCWNGEEFENLLTEKLDKSVNIHDSRGIYAGDIFYIVSSQGITSYDRLDEYKYLKKISF